MGGDGQLFFQIASVIVIASVLALALFRVRQPLIIAYILAGLLVGPQVLGLVEGNEVFQALSQVGVAFLLFLVGIRLDWRQVKDVGAVALMAGVAQMIVTTLAGYGLATVLGFGMWESWFLGVAFAFSSTIVVVKLLADKEELDRLYGRMSVGILIVQDLCAMLVLLMLSQLQDLEAIGQLLTVSLFKGALVIIALLIISHWVLRPIIRYAARSQELLALTAVGWCFAVTSILFTLGFGIEIGALLAGIALAGTTPHREIESKVKPLRDFFLVIFFIVLGTHITFASMEGQWGVAAAFAALILLGKPLLSLLVLRSMGHHPRAGFLTGTAIAQISEFSFLVIAAGAAAGLLGAQLISLVTVVGVFTIAVSSYFISYNERLYQACAWAFEWMAPKRFAESRLAAHTADVLLFGYRDMGAAVLPAIKRLTNCFLVVDFDPGQVDELERYDIPVTYGDVASDELLSDVRAEKAKMVISTIPDVDVNTQVIRYLKRKHSRATVIVTGKSNREAVQLYKAGATFVIVPSILSGELFAELLKKKKTTKRLWQVAAKA